uniref:Chemokine interleukin-8-like domain-containing protein n=1 Tax=Scleropages formosus TaxID=113540 RepID=A0A8C9SR81_SCLFO
MSCSTLLLLLLLLLLLFFIECSSHTVTQSSYENCCLKYVKKIKNSTKKMVIDYRKQVTDGSCNIFAIVFIMKRRRHFCADPEQQWVKNLMMTVDAKVLC